MHKIQNQRTIDSGYFKSFKEPTNFMKELTKKKKKTDCSLEGYLSFYKNSRTVIIVSKLIIWKKIENQWESEYILYTHW